MYKETRLRSLQVFSILNVGETRIVLSFTPQQKLKNLSYSAFLKMNKK